MDRRKFLTRAIMAATALAVDPEELLWQPTKKIFVMPEYKPMVFIEHRIPELDLLARYAAEIQKLLQIPEYYLNDSMHFVGFRHRLVEKSALLAHPYGNEK